MMIVKEEKNTFSLLFCAFIYIVLNPKLNHIPLNLLMIRDGKRNPAGLEPKISGRI